MYKVSIVGCGWLGKPLCDKLSENFETECFSRINTKENSSFWQADTIVISIHTKDNYLETLKEIATLSKKSVNIILMSSTSVYREFNSKVDEDILIKEPKLQREAELLLQSLKKNVLILRLGGLMGDDRISGKWKNISTFSDGPVNYIHKDDVISITKKIIEKNIIKGIYNLVSPLHPLRSEIHRKNAKKFDLKLGTFEGKTSRLVLSKKLIKELNYEFIYPNPLAFWE